LVLDTLLGPEGSGFVAWLAQGRRFTCFRVCGVLVCVGPLLRWTAS
jgi:hypothetical protein